MAEFLTVFAFGTLGFWIMFAIASCIVMAAIEFEKGMLATFTLVASMLLVHYGSGEKFFGYVIRHPLDGAIFIGSYFTMGALWGVLKWWLFVRREREKYDEAHANYLKDYSSGKTHSKWDHYVNSGHYGDVIFLYKPKPSEQKRRVLMWMTYWPWSMVWTLINDPVRRAFRAIYYRIAGLLTSISERGFAGTERDVRETA